MTRFDEYGYKLSEEARRLETWVTGFKVSEEARRLGTWIILGLLVVQVLIVPWEVAGSGDVYAPIFATPGAGRILAEIRMGRLLLQLALTVGLLVLWRLITTQKDRQLTGTENRRERKE